MIPETINILTAELVGPYQIHLCFDDGAEKIGSSRIVVEADTAKNNHLAKPLM